MLKLISNSPLQTKEIAKEFAAELIKIKGNKSAVVVSLRGDLGTGKSTLTRQVLKELGVRQKIVSPTFTLMRKYKLSSRNFTAAYHLDCYRLKATSEIDHLGLRDILKNPQFIVFIEWPEMISRALPKDKINISIKHGKNENQRIWEIK